MNYVVTNIRLPEEDYLKLKTEAAKKRKSLSAVIREKLAVRNTTQNTQLVRRLLNLAEKAEKESWEGPSDLAVNHDDYFTK